MTEPTPTAPALYGERAELYDLLYHWKDYARESERLHALLAAEGVPDGATLLDAACGTGAHLVHLARWYRAGGFDLYPTMLAVARRKLPEAELFEADLRTFRVARPVRACVCLFSAIAYLHGEEDLRRAAGRFAAALAPGGVLIVEPWLALGDFTPGHASMQTYDSAELKLCRQCVARSAGDVSLFDMHWLVARAGGEVEHFVEHHELWMCPRSLMQSAFADAGFDVRYEPDGLMPQRGLFIARRRGGA